LTQRVTPGGIPLRPGPRNRGRAGYGRSAAPDGQMRAGCVTAAAQFHMASC